MRPTSDPAAVEGPPPGVHTVMVVRPDGSYGLLSINMPKADADVEPDWFGWFYAQIGTDTIERVQCLDELDCWVDENAFLRDFAPNLFVTRMLAALSVAPPDVILGPAVFAGRGPVGLNANQIQRLAAAYRRVERDLSA